MSIGINFNRERATHYVDCLANSKPIEGQWTADEMLALAGACMFVRQTQGPATWMGRTAVDIHPEHKEAANETLEDEIHAAIQWYADRTMDVHDGQYDEHFEPTHKAMITMEDDGPSVVPVEGFKAT